MNLSQQRFYGYQKTPLLWKGELSGLTQFELEQVDLKIDSRIDDTIRLGNYVERLVSLEFSNHDSIEILKENAQIISDKTTLGEIDCLLKIDDQPVHIEIAYKFYLYDPNVGDSFLDHWIGPNRRDSLVLKLDKVKKKQFPLLYKDDCKPLLEELKLDIQDIQQRTFFKAQLFLPFQSEIDFPELNSNCVQGFYINSWEMELFKDCKFYIPRKLDWLIEPHTQVEWISYDSIKKRIPEFHHKKSAPLCWLKQQNGEISKIFIVWWD
jgi:hypothetical protein